MKNLRVFVAFRALTLAAAAFAVAVMAVGCAVDTGSGEEGAEAIDLSEVNEAETQGTCCDYAYFTCPSTKERFYYSIVGCGDPIYTQAKNACENACPTQCVGSGWIIISPCEIGLGIDQSGQ